MATVTIYGASDDLIEVEGDITDEFCPTYRGTGYLAVSDGTVLSITYNGEWAIRRVAKGSAIYEHREFDLEADEYSDVVTLTGDVRWIVHGTEFLRNRK